MVARLLLIPYTVAVLLITWLPAEEAGRVTGIVAVLAHLLTAWGIPFVAAYAVLEFLANVALFAPLGVLLILGWRRIPPWAAVAIGCAGSVVIELVQLAIPSRYSTLSDVIANTLGTAAGVLVARATIALADRRRRRAAMGRSARRSSGSPGTSASSRR